MERNCLLSIVLWVSLLLASVNVTAQHMTLDWYRHIGTAKAEQGRSIALDRDGNIFLAGMYIDSTDLDPGPDSFKLHTTVNHGMFLAKYDPSGGFLWAKNMPPTFNTNMPRIAVDDSGSVYIGGVFGAAFNFDPGSSLYAISPGSTVDVYLAKFGSDGAIRWVRQTSGSSASYAYVLDVMVDSSGGVYAAGGFSATIDFNAGHGAQSHTAKNSANGTFDSYVLKFDTSGDFSWVRTMGTDNSEYAYQMASDDIGNVYVVAQAGVGVWEFEKDPATALQPLSADAIAFKLSPSGDLLWSRLIGGQYFDDGYGIAWHPDGSVYCNGTYRNTLFFHTDPAPVVTAVSGDDMFLVKMDTAGDFIWGRSIGGAGSIYPGRMVTDKHGSVYTIGRYSGGTIDFDPGAGTEERVGYSNEDAFLVKLSSSGAYMWLNTIASSGYERGIGLAAASSGDIYATGFFSNKVVLNPDNTSDSVQSRGNNDAYIQKFVCADTSSFVLNENVCGSGYELNGIVYTQAGTYTQVLTNSKGCDSTLVLHLSFSNKRAVIEPNGDILSTTEEFSSYRWLLGEDTIAGAVDRSYHVAENGSYRVAVEDENGCRDTSAAYQVDNVSVAGIHAGTGAVHIYPNPSTGLVHIRSAMPVRTTVLSLDGRLIVDRSDKTLLDLSDLPAGVYIIRVNSLSGSLIRVDKLVRED